ncbi:MAG: class I SAM-dependent rRNA methyltransferase [Longimicrobiales bacterium]
MSKKPDSVSTTPDSVSKTRDSVSKRRDPASDVRATQTSPDVARVSARGGDRWRRQQHPWIYRSDIETSPTVGAGAVRVVGARGEELGMALWSPSSQIALRMITTRHEPIDGDFWHDRIERAWRYRQTLNVNGNAWRMIHGEGDGLPSLVADWYDGHLVIQMLSAGLDAHRDDIVEALRTVTNPTGILARNDVSVRDHEQLPRTVELLYGTVPEEIEVVENEIRYLAAPWTGQKTGAFLDQRENRLRVGQLAHGRALDCFSYHGSFALHLAARASHVTAIDSSAEALARAAHNVTRNASVIAPDSIDFVEANAFDFLRGEEAAGAQYDTIVLDPPAFAKRRDAIDKAVRGYKEINLRAMKLLTPGGILATFTCSYHMHRELFRQMLEEAAADAGRTMRWIETRSQALDHPDIVQIPESAYLKGAILQAVE